MKSLYLCGLQDFDQAIAKRFKRVDGVNQHKIRKCIAGRKLFATNVSAAQDFEVGEETLQQYKNRGR
jgi:hypothetical protein